MENEVASSFGSLLWILFQVLCIGITLFCALLLGAIQLERVKGGPVHPRTADWSVYLVLAILIGFGLSMLTFMDAPPVV